MKQKTRYNIRLAEKKGVTLRIGTPDDFDMLYKMYAETSVRDGFVIRDEEYYKTVWQLFMANAQSPVSNLQLQLPITNYPLPNLSSPKWTTNPSPRSLSFISPDVPITSMACRAMSHREKMPTYLLQWEAMKRAKAKG